MFNAGGLHLYRDIMVNRAVSKPFSHLNTDSGSRPLFPEYGKNNASASTETRKYITDIKYHANQLNKLARTMQAGQPPLFAQMISAFQKGQAAHSLSALSAANTPDRQAAALSNDQNPFGSAQDDPLSGILNNQEGIALLYSPEDDIDEIDETEESLESQEEAALNPEQEAKTILATLNAFIDGYNQLLSTADSYSSTGASKLSARLTGAFDAHSGSLYAAGITADANGNLSLDTARATEALQSGAMERALGLTESGSTGFLNHVGQLAAGADANPTQYLGQSGGGFISGYAGGFNNPFSAGNTLYNSRLSLLNPFPDEGLMFDAVF